MAGTIKDEYLYIVTTFMYFLWKILHIIRKIVVIM